MDWQEITIRLGVAFLLGGVIGLERQWRSHYVGLRTNTLITLGSAAMMIFALMLPEGDPPNLNYIASNIIAGVGFVCAGVIFREGATAKGFSTAATLWCSVAVGMFTGMAYFEAAVILSIFIILVNLLLRPIAYSINARDKKRGLVKRPRNESE